MRGRISIPKENRIWNLREQGYDYDSIARIVNTKPGSIHRAIYRVSTRWKFPNQRYFNRKRGFFSDDQINDIKMLYDKGWSIADISKEYEVSYQCIHAICNNRSYTTPEEGYEFTFVNRLVSKK